MAETGMEDILKPFYQRASEAEDRLSKLEAAVPSEKDSGNEHLLEMISDLRSKLQDAEAEKITEWERVAQKEIEKLTVENGKLQYRVAHLVRALKEADCKLLEAKLGHDSN